MDTDIHEQRIATGFSDLDELLGGGFGQTDFVLLVSFTSVGKTSMALNIAEQVALGTSGPLGVGPFRARVPVGFFSFEMDARTLGYRLIAQGTGIACGGSNLSETDAAETVAYCTDRSTMPIFMYDGPALNVQQLRAKAQTMVRERGIGLFVIDYIGLMPGEGRTEQEKISGISGALKAMARDLRVPVLALSQLNRGPESREDGVPRTSDLRSSGSLEQDADTVLLLHRAAIHHQTDPNWASDHAHEAATATLHVAKNRNGAVGTVTMVFDEQATRFKSLGTA